jgi:serine O-acetyltransferase
VASRWERSASDASGMTDGVKRSQDISLSGASLVAHVRADLAANYHRTGIAGFLVALTINTGFSTAFRFRMIQYFAHRSAPLKLIARLIWRAGVRKTACHLHWNAKIGPGLSLPHPTGIVVGEGVTLGSGATIFQHVTLGTNVKGGRAYPKIGDNVTLYAGACLIGAISVGNGATVGAHSVVNFDIPEGATATPKGLRSGERMPPLVDGLPRR